MGWNDHVDWEEERIKEIKQDKKATAQTMRKHGMDEETIRADVWSRADVQCQGTCQSWLTHEENNSGLDMCWECKLESMG